MGRDWETAAELRSPKVTDENPVRHTRRRSTKRWCRGKVGVVHAGEITLDRYSESLRLYPRQDRTEWRSGGVRVGGEIGSTASLTMGGDFTAGTSDDVSTAARSSTTFSGAQSVPTTPPDQTDI